MKERIYTIPLSEVIDPGLGCPFCLLAAKAENGLLRVYLEGCLVDIDWRGRILREWLCLRHLEGMQTQTRKLGGAIVAQALLQDALMHLADGATLPGWGSSCVACQDLARTLTHHAESFIRTWLAEPDFRDAAAKADPFCLPHLSLLYQQAGQAPKKQRELIRAAMLQREEEALKPLQADVDWFVRKFDARFQEAPWRGAEDAVERAVAILAGGRKQG